METALPPVVIPMWLTGFDTLMPEGRSFPYKYLPRPGRRLSVTFGDPIPFEIIEKALTNGGRTEYQRNLGRNDNIETIRAAVTAVIQEQVESLGRSVCGNSLSHHGSTRI